MIASFDFRGIVILLCGFVFSAMISTPFSAAYSRVDMPSMWSASSSRPRLRRPVIAPRRAVSASESVLSFATQGVHHAGRGCVEGIVKARELEPLFLIRFGGDGLLPPFAPEHWMFVEVVGDLALESRRQIPGECWHPGVLVDVTGVEPLPRDTLNMLT